MRNGSFDSFLPGCWDPWLQAGRAGGVPWLGLVGLSLALFLCHVLRWGSLQGPCSSASDACTPSQTPLCWEMTPSWLCPVASVCGKMGLVSLVWEVLAETWWIFFYLWERTCAILTCLTVQFSGVNNIHTVVQQITRAFSHLLGC